MSTMGRHDLAGRDGEQIYARLPLGKVNSHDSLPLLRLLLHELLRPRADTLRRQRLIDSRRTLSWSPVGARVVNAASGSYFVAGVVKDLWHRVSQQVRAFGCDLRRSDESVERTASRTRDQNLGPRICACQISRPALDKFDKPIFHKADLAE